MEKFSFFKQRAVQIAIISYVLGVTYWLWIYTTDQVGTLHNELWVLLFIGIFPTLGGAVGFLVARRPPVNLSPKFLLNKFRKC